MTMKFFAAISTALLLSACASTPQTNALLSQHANQEAHTSHKIESVPFIQQTKHYCGPSSLAMAAQFNQVLLNPESLASMMVTESKKGSLPTDFLGATRRIGLLGHPVRTLSELIREIDRNHIIVPLVNFGSDANPIWHYAVIYGYDLEKEVLILNSGENQGLELDLAQFERAWQKANYWALAIVKPGDLPATAKSVELLASATILEKINQPHSAGQVYQTVTQYWPEQPVAWFGLGNTYYAQKKWLQAKDAFLQVTRIHPSQKLAWINLSHAYLKLNQPSQAKIAFDHAKEL